MMVVFNAPLTVVAGIFSKRGVISLGVLRCPGQKESIVYGNGQKRSSSSHWPRYTDLACWTSFEFLAAAGQLEGFC